MRTLVTILALALAACSSPEAPEEQALAPAGASVAAPTPSAAPAEAAGAPILLESLTDEDRGNNRLDGELGCAFYASRGDEPLLIAASNVGDAAGGEALVKVDSDPVKLPMEGEGGYDRMANGARFVSGTLAADVEVTGNEPLAEDPPIAGESPIFTARLTLAREGRSIAVDGFYECGP